MTAMFKNPCLSSSQPFYSQPSQTTSISTGSYHNFDSQFLPHQNNPSKFSSSTHLKDTSQNIKNQIINLKLWKQDLNYMRSLLAQISKKSPYMKNQYKIGVNQLNMEKVKEKVMFLENQLDYKIGGLIQNMKEFYVGIELKIKNIQYLLKTHLEKEEFTGRGSFLKQQKFINDSYQLNSFQTVRSQNQRRLSRSADKKLLKKLKQSKSFVDHENIAISTCGFTQNIHTDRILPSELAKSYVHQRQIKTPSFSVVDESIVFDSTKIIEHKKALMIKQSIKQKIKNDQLLHQKKYSRKEGELPKKNPNIDSRKSLKNIFNKQKKQQNNSIDFKEEKSRKIKFQ